jgi:Na+-transporting methylmalonyl-CoA/oxaloacetate decarboxylase gamma subunit
MLSVLGVLAFVWACLIIAICAICAVGGAADEQSEEWYREHKRTAEDVDQQRRGGSLTRRAGARVNPHVLVMHITGQT